MTKKQKANVFYDTGGSGKMPTSRGEVWRWWVPCQYTSIPRLLMATRLALGPATLKQLEAVTGGYQSVTWQIIHNWVGRGFVTWATVYGGGVRGKSRWREVTLTDRGRQDLWRYGWVTRRLRFSERQDVPLRDDTPADPLEALRLHARNEFLRPAALALLYELIGWPKQHVLSMGNNMDNYAAARVHFRQFRAAGFVTDCGDFVTHRGPIHSPRWVLNAAGHEALDRHIDALRRVCGASGFVPTRDCEYYYPYEDQSRCTWSMSPGKPPPCPDCPYWWLYE